MKRTNIIAAALLMIPEVCFAASFNCGKANSQFEIMICSSPELNYVDGQMGNV